MPLELFHRGLELVADVELVRVKEEKDQVAALCEPLAHLSDIGRVHIQTLTLSVRVAQRSANHRHTSPSNTRARGVWGFSFRGGQGCQGCQSRRFPLSFRGSPP